MLVCMKTVFTEILKLKNTTRMEITMSPTMVQQTATTATILKANQTSIITIKRRSLQMQKIMTAVTVQIIQLITTMLVGVKTPILML
nr:hypothetical protein [uncultured bacterium]